MKRGSIPLWLLRNLPAQVGLACSIWPQMIMVISSGRRAMLGAKISPHIYDCIMRMLPIAEAHLHYALCRQAWCALSRNVREVKLETPSPITSWSQVAARFEVYRADMMDLRTASTRFTGGLREIYRIRTSVDANTTHAAPASTGALRTAHHELDAVSRKSPLALMLSSAQSARPSKHVHGLTTARGSPTSSSSRHRPLPLPRKRKLPATHSHVPN